MRSQRKSAPRPLPRTDRGRRSRTALIASAAELFYAQGVAATSLDEVLARSGAGKSQLYHYFSGRQELVEAVVELQIERVLGVQSRLGSIERWSDLEQWADDLLALHRTPAGPLACPVGSLAAEIDRDPLLRAAAANAFGRWAALLEQALARLRPRGELRPDADPAVSAMRILSALQGGMLIAHTLNDIDPLVESLRRLLDDLRTPASTPTAARQKRRPSHE